MEVSIFQKLKIKQGMQYLIKYAPKDFPIPKDCVPMETKLNYLHLFCENTMTLHHLMEEVSDYINSSCLFWISYPKKASTLYQDLHRNSLWVVMISYGFHHSPKCLWMIHGQVFA